MKRNITNEIIDKAIDIGWSDSNRRFRLWVTPKIFKQINKLAKSYTTYRISGVPKNDNNTDYGVKTFVLMGLTFYVSIDNTIKDFKLTKIDGKI